MQVNAFRHNGTAEGHGGRGGEWAAIKMGQSRQAPQDNNSIQKYQYPTMTRAAGATGAADTEEGRRTTRRAVSHWKRLQVTRPCTNMSQCKLTYLHVNMLVGAHVSLTDTKSQHGCWRKAVWTCLAATQSLHSSNNEPLTKCLLQWKLD